MRVADKMAFSQVTQNLSKNRSEMQDLQNQAATQKRVVKPSDDPMAAARVLVNRVDEKSNEQFIKSLNSAKSFLEFTDQSLGELTESLIRAKELALSQADDASGNAQSRRVTGKEIEQIYNQSVQIANRKLGERYVFSGHKTTTMPFDIMGNYRGDDGDIKIQINKDSFLPMNLSGDKVFLGRGLGNDGFIHARYETPKNVTEMQDYKQEEQQRLEQNQEVMGNHVDVRGPSNIGDIQKSSDVVGTNVFSILKNLQVSLEANDKAGVQDSIDYLDQAINQVVLARSQVGSRVGIVNSSIDSTQKAKMDNRIAASQLEDADVFQVMSDITKNEGTLRATMETSGKLIQPSLLDFLK